MKTLSLATFLLLLLAAAAKAEVQDPRAILDKAKQATGGSAWDGVRSLHTPVSGAEGRPPADVPGANANHGKPDNYDRSGMWINREGEGFKVMDVVKEGPAAAAGLKAGDEILAIDGKSAKELGLSATRSRFKDSAPGTQVKLQVRSGESVRNLVLTLSDLA